MSPWRAWLLCTALLGGAGLVRAQAEGLSEQLERLRQEKATPTPPGPDRKSVV